MFIEPERPIKISNYDKSHIEATGLLNQHFCKNKFQNLQRDNGSWHFFSFSHLEYGKHKLP